MFSLSYLNGSSAASDNNRQPSSAPSSSFFAAGSRRKGAGQQGFHRGGTSRGEQHEMPEEEEEDGRGRHAEQQRSDRHRQSLKPFGRLSASSSSSSSAVSSEFTESQDASQGALYFAVVVQVVGVLYLGLVMLASWVDAMGPLRTHYYEQTSAVAGGGNGNGGNGWGGGMLFPPPLISVAGTSLVSSHHDASSSASPAGSWLVPFLHSASDLFIHCFSVYVTRNGFKRYRSLHAAAAAAGFLTTAPTTAGGGGGSSSLLSLPSSFSSFILRFVTNAFPSLLLVGLLFVGGVAWNWAHWYVWRSSAGRVVAAEAEENAKTLCDVRASRGDGGGEVATGGTVKSQPAVAREGDGETVSEQGLVPPPPAADLRRWCKHCSHWQPIRTRHCHKCARCIPKFDHHCFWVGTCVGERNHFRFLVALVAGAFYLAVASIVLFHYGLAWREVSSWRYAAAVGRGRRRSGRGGGRMTTSPPDVVEAANKTRAAATIRSSSGGAAVDDLPMLCELWSSASATTTPITTAIGPPTSTAAADAKGNNGSGSAAAAAAAAAAASYPYYYRHYCTAPWAATASPYTFNLVANAVPLFLFAVAFCMFWFIMALLVFHLLMVATNSTTWEFASGGGGGSGGRSHPNRQRAGERRRDGDGGDGGGGDGEGGGGGGGGDGEGGGGGGGGGISYMRASILEEPFNAIGVLLLSSLSSRLSSQSPPSKTTTTTTSAAVSHLDAALGRDTATATTRRTTAPSSSHAYEYDDSTRILASWASECWRSVALLLCCWRGVLRACVAMGGGGLWGRLSTRRRRYVRARDVSDDDDGDCHAVDMGEEGPVPRPLPSPPFQHRPPPPLPPIALFTAGLLHNIIVFAFAAAATASPSTPETSYDHHDVVVEGEGGREGGDVIAALFLRFVFGICVDDGLCQSSAAPTSHSCMSPAAPQPLLSHSRVCLPVAITLRLRHARTAVVAVGSSKVVTFASYVTSTVVRWVLTYLCCCFGALGRDISNHKTEEAEDENCANSSRAAVASSSLWHEVVGYYHHCRAPNHIAVTAAVDVAMASMDPFPPSLLPLPPWVIRWRRINNAAAASSADSVDDCVFAEICWIPYR